MTTFLSSLELCLHPSLQSASLGRRDRRGAVGSPWTTLDDVQPEAACIRGSLDALFLHLHLHQANHLPFR